MMHFSVHSTYPFNKFVCLHFSRKVLLNPFCHSVFQIDTGTCLAVTLAGGLDCRGRWQVLQDVTQEVRHASWASQHQPGHGGFQGKIHSLRKKEGRESKRETILFTKYLSVFSVMHNKEVHFYNCLISNVYLFVPTTDIKICDFTSSMLASPEISIQMTGMSMLPLPEKT